MNSRMVAQLAKTNNLDVRQTALLADSLLALASTNEQLVSQSRSLQRDLARLESDVVNGMNVNSLGVLQSSGVSLDVLCGVRAAQLDGLRRLCSLLEVNLQDALSTLA